MTREVEGRSNWCTLASGDEQANDEQANDEQANDEQAGEQAGEPSPPADTVSFGTGDDGRWRIRASFDAVTGQQLEDALAERRDALFPDDEDVTWADAFSGCFERSLDAVESSARRDRYRTWLHLDVTEGSATTTDGWRIPMALKRRADAARRVNRPTRAA